MIVLCPICGESCAPDPPGVHCESCNISWFVPDDDDDE